MYSEFPYQIVTFLDREPEVNEPVYYGERGWFVQLALKRRFKLNGISEDELIESLKKFFTDHKLPDIVTGTLVKPERMPVHVIDISNQHELSTLHNQLIVNLGENIVSRYPDRDGENYFAHVTTEHAGTVHIPVDEYTNRQFGIQNVWLLKDVGDWNSKAIRKIF